MQSKEKIMNLVKEFNEHIKKASDTRDQIWDELQSLEIDTFDFEEVSIESQSNNTCNFAENFSYSEDAIEVFLDEKTDRENER